MQNVKANKLLERVQSNKYRQINSNKETLIDVEKLYNNRDKVIKAF